MDQTPIYPPLLSEFPHSVGNLSERHRRRALVVSSSASILPVVQVPLELVREAQAILTDSDAIERDFASDASITGTAFLIHPIGLFLTAAHVISRWMDASKSGSTSEDAPTKLLHVQSMKATSPGRAFLHFATVICADWAADEQDDVAILYAPHSQQLGLPPLQLSGLPPTEGDRVMAFGYPYGMHLIRNGKEEGYGGPFVTEGTVSKVLPSPAFPIPSQHLFAFDGAVRKGMSGGPVIDSATGLVVGVTIENYPPPASALPGSFGLATPTSRCQQLIGAMLTRLREKGLISSEAQSSS